MSPFRTFITPPAACQYLPDQVAQLRYLTSDPWSPADYAQLLQRGWRRFGIVAFTPACPACTRCQPLRVIVASFHPRATQRRTWRRNVSEVSIRVGPPALTQATRDLFERFHRYKANTQAWPLPDGDLLAMLADPRFPTEQWTYCIGDVPVAVGYVDALPVGLSAVYFFYDPDQRHRGLGTFNVLSIVAAARERGLPHVYLGYYVRGCRSMEYKTAFQPSEVFAAGTWQPQGS
jgi:leucyl-tRNA---protein transferase